MASTGERTEEATEKRKQDSRKKGQVARSQDLSAVLVLLGSVLLLRVFGGRMIGGLMDFMSGAFRNLDEAELSVASISGNETDVMLFTLEVLAPLLLGLMLVSVAANVIQTGPLLSGQALKPQLSRINPISGAKRILGKQGLLALARNLLKLTIVGGILALGLRGRFADVSRLGAGSLQEDLDRFIAMAFEITLLGAAALLALADFFFQRKLHAQQIRMSKQDVRDENKQQEDDPTVKGRMRQMRRDFFNRMMTAVPQADVVITNPTHFAVALRYDPLRHAAPMVIAKGEQLTALRIRQLAEQNGVPIWEDKFLARALYASVSVGKPIPAELFQAVAEVLAFIFRLRAGQPARPPQPTTAEALGLPAGTLAMAGAGGA